MVAKVVRDHAGHEDGLNLSDESSAREDETMETYDLQEVFQREQIWPDGDSPKVKVCTAVPNPRLTLVFMAYEKRAGPKEESLANVSHLAFKFAQDSSF